MKNFKFILWIATALFATSTFAGSELVPLPDGYKNTFTEYAVINRTKKKQVVYTFANKVAVDSATMGQPLDAGSILVMEVYKAKLDNNKKPITDDKGFYIKDSMAAIVVMEKRDGWGDAYPEKIRNGDWEYAKYKPNKDKPVNKDSVGCLTCHKKMEQKDYIFSFDELISVKK